MLSHKRRKRPVEENLAERRCACSKLRRAEKGWRFFAPPPYRRGHDHDSFHRRFHTRLPASRRASLELELIALRHQVSVLWRQRPSRIWLFSTDRLLWVWLYRVWPPRLFDICSDQIRALRSRMFVGAIARGDIQGALLRMGNSARNFDLKSARATPPSEYDEVMSEADVAAAAAHPTDLNALSPAAFDRIARHGYEVADRTLTTYSPKYFSTSNPWRDVSEVYSLAATHNRRQNNSRAGARAHALLSYDTVPRQYRRDFGRG